MNESKNLPVDIVCAQCTQTFQDYLSQKRKFCSRKCQHAAWAQGKKPGKPCSAEAKRKISIANGHPTGRSPVVTDEMRRKVGLAQQLIFAANPENHLANLHKARKSSMQKYLTKQPPASELVMRDILLELEHPFLHRVYWGGFELDFVCGIHVIEVDGDYWHGNPNRWPVLLPVQQKVRAKDARKNEQLAAHGYKLLRVWESDLKDREAVKLRVEAFLRG